MIRVAPAAIAGFVALCTINVWLAVVITEEAGADRSVTITMPDYTPTFSVSADAVPGTKPLDAYRPILTEPIFLKTRQAYVAPPPAPPPAPPIIVAPVAPLDPGLLVAGVMINRDLKKAYLLNKADRNGTWVSEGESFSGWKVETVGRAGVKLQNGSRTLELELYPPR
jgi:hypothetical protein